MSTPLASPFKLSSESYRKSEEEIEKIYHVLYSSAVDSLMYAMVCTRLDLSYAVSVMSHFICNPSKDHWDVGK